MEKVEGKGGEVGGEREGSLGDKLRREALVGRKGGPCTPVLSWRLSAIRYKIMNQKPFPNTVSARKLGAALWEFQHSVRHSQMTTGFSNGVTSGALRRRSCHLSRKEKGLDLSHFPGHAHAFSTSAEQPESARSLQEDVGASFARHRRSNERVEQKISPKLQPEFPPSCVCSMEGEAAFVPASPSRTKGRIGESHYGLKTSTELLRVLNRIWSLEEQQVSNIALIKALKTELDHTRVNINDSIQQRNAEQGEIDDLIKQFAEDKLVWKNKERNRIEAAIKSAKDELDDERKLRKRSESLHRKLAWNLCQVKSSLSNALKDLETEKKSRILLEELCDEFARGIKDYEQEMHALKTCPGRTNHGRLIRHISESWLDERMQMQNDGESRRMKKSSAAEKLYFEIESFLQDKHKHVDADTMCRNLLRMGRPSSTDSIPFNEVVSGPQVVAGDKEDSIDSDELNKPSRDDNSAPNGNASMKLNGRKGKLRSRERTKGPTPSSLQVKFEEQMAWAMSDAGKDKSLVVNGEGGISHNSEHREGGLVSNHRRNEQSSGGGGNMHPQNNYGEASCNSKGGGIKRVPAAMGVENSRSRCVGVILQGASWVRGEHPQAKAS